MKTTYQKPSVEIVKLETTRMIAASKLLDDTLGLEQDLSKAPTTNETSGNLSRYHNSLWDDEDEW
ncbi:MAG: hypothetical protein IJT98_04915 [Prevotella sp.]|nr:hypothetical protein [Prevotella sp.]